MLTLNYAGDTAAEAPSQHLGLEDFERAGVRVAERRFEEKDTIFAPGDPDSQLYILLEGTVRLYKIYSDYKEATIALLKDGGVCGELSLDEVPCENAFAEAVTGVRVAKVGKSALNEVIKRRPSFAMKLFFAFSERLRHQDLANMIVSTREAVSKVMSEFQRAGLIEVGKCRISVSPQLAKSYGLAVILVFVGAKFVAQGFGLHIPIVTSLLVILVAIVASMAVSLGATRGNFHRGDDHPQGER